MKFNDYIELPDDAAHWYIDKAAEENLENVFEAFEYVLYNFYLMNAEELE